MHVLAQKMGPKFLWRWKMSNLHFCNTEMFWRPFFFFALCFLEKKRWEAEMLPIPERITGCKFEKIFEFHVSVLTSTRGFLKKN